MSDDVCKKELVSLHLRFQYGLGAMTEVSNFEVICVCSVCRPKADFVIKLNGQDLAQLRNLAFFDPDMAAAIKSASSLKGR